MTTVITLLTRPDCALCAHAKRVLDRVGAEHPLRVDEVMIVDDIFNADLERAKDIVLGHARLSARDALHLAVMERHGVSRILSFDSGFDGFPGITRISQ